MPNLSVKRCAGALLRCAVWMRWMIFCSALSCAGRMTTASTDAPQIHRAGEDGVADRLVHRRGFAGEVRFVGGGLAFHDLGIDGK